MTDVRFILVILSLWHLAEGNYEFHVRVHSYSHTNRRDWQNKYCDTFSNNACENVFLFCLQAHGASQTSSYCPYGQYRTAGHPLTATTASFNDGANIFAPGVNNPLVFSGRAGIPWIQSFQFQVRVDDEDHPDSDDLIDRVFVVESNFPIGDSFTSRRTFTGIYGNVRLDLSYKAICQENYYGSTCTVYCAGRDDSTGHFECNTEGEPVCLAGWADSQNNCLTPVCSPACPTNSQCTSPGVCTCVTGWSGENCTHCIPATGCDHGSCNSPGECICETGYSGTLCEIDEDVCGHQSPCQNGGNCSNTGPDSHFCTCPATFNGPNCESDVDECTSDPCLNGATCVNNHGATPTCLCAAGFTGEDCGVEIDECESSPCQNGATCNDLLDDFNCSCPTGFTGAVCDVNIDDCHPDFCLHGGTCVDQIDGYTCDCLPSYAGAQCEDDLPPPCSSSPCPFGTFCVDNIEMHTYNCDQCHPGVESCDDNIVIVNPDAQGGKNGTDTKPQANAALIGGVVGGVVAALLLLCLVVAIVILCTRCCVCISLKSHEDETYETIGTSAQRNPLYLGTSTILSSRSGTLRSSVSPVPRYDGSNANYVEFSNVVDDPDGGDLTVSRQHQNPMYAVAQTAILNGTPLLPPPRNSSSGRPVSPGHYEQLPGDNSVKQVMASGKYDQLKPMGMPEVAQSGKYDSLSPVAAPPATGNLYVIDRDGYKVIPRNPRPLSPDTKKTNETTDAPLPTSNFNPYDD